MDFGLSGAWLVCGLRLRRGGLRGGCGGGGGLLFDKYGAPGCCSFAEFLSVMMMTGKLALI